MAIATVRELDTLLRKVNMSESDRKPLQTDPYEKWLKT